MKDGRAIFYPLICTVAFRPTEVASKMQTDLFQFCLNGQEHISHFA